MTRFRQAIPFGRLRMMVGHELLSQPSREEILDGVGNIAVPGDECGDALLLKRLQEKFGSQEPGQPVQALAAFFIFERGRLSMQDYFAM